MTTSDKSQDELRQQIKQQIVDWFQPHPDYVYNDNVINDYLEKVLQLIAANNARVEKAYGGCHNCYGKGYATVNEYASGYGTDGDIGGFQGHVKWKLDNMKFCTCERGKQLKTMVSDCPTATGTEGSEQ